MEKLGLEDIARLVGAEPDALKKYYNPSWDFSFERLTGKERDDTVLAMLKKIDSPELTIAGPQKKAQWEKGWDENLEDFKKSGADFASLVPKYIRPGAILRLDGDYIRPTSDQFELNYFSIMRDYLTEKYLSDANPLYEFGCGPALNVVALAKQFPKKEIHGLDWVSAPKEIIEIAREKYGLNIHGHVFDMFSPDPSLVLPPGSAVFSSGALEQLGENFKIFLTYLLGQKPKIVVTINHFTELYDPDVLNDYLAIKFERRRNYLYGFIPELQRLKKEGKVEIVTLHRSHIGSMVHDGYSYVVWRVR